MAVPKRKQDPPCVPGCFVVTAPLDATPRQRREIKIRFRTGAQVYNQGLAIFLKRLLAMRQDLRWQAAPKLPKKQRIQAYSDLKKEYQFSKYAAINLAPGVRTGIIKRHLYAKDVQDTMVRVFTSVERHLYGSGKPRFKRAKEGLSSMAGMSPEAPLTFIGPQVIRWGKDFELPIRWDPDNPCHAYAQMLLSEDTGNFRKARIVKRKIKGRIYYYAQLTVAGTPLQRYPTLDGAIVSLDLGPSVAAMFSDTGTGLERICDELRPDWDRLRRQQQIYDRQHRLGSPLCFSPQGGHIKGNCHWKSRSKRSEGIKAKLAEQHRVIAQYRKSLQGNFLNRVLTHGNQVQLEALSYKAWQRNSPKWGRGREAPGFIRGEVEPHDSHTLR